MHMHCERLPLVTKWLPALRISPGAEPVKPEYDHVCNIYWIIAPIHWCNESSFVGQSLFPLASTKALVGPALLRFTGNSIKSIVMA